MREAVKYSIGEQDFKSLRQAVFMWIRLNT